MEKKLGKGVYMAFGLLNVKRCFMCSVISVAILPVFLLLKLVEPENAVLASLSMPLTFFSVLSIPFAYLLYQVAKQKAHPYYEIVMWMYLLYFQMYMAFLSSVCGSNVIYYAAVIIGAYVVYLNTVQYMVLAMTELLACMWFMLLTENPALLSISGYLVLAAVHMFALFASRECYDLREGYIIEERKLKKEMNQSERDPLTGLINRRGLDRRIGEFWDKSVAKKELVGVCILDIDHFKRYNDRFGHVQGDACIKQVAQSVLKTVGNAGYVSRIGGEEFMVFVRGMDVKGLQELAESIRAGVERMGISAGSEGVVTISLGMEVAHLDEDSTLQGLYGRADRQLYIAKNEGRNCVRCSGMRKRYSKIG